MIDICFQIILCFLVVSVVAGKVKRYTTEEFNSTSEDYIYPAYDYNTGGEQQPQCQKCCHNIRVFMANFEGRFSDVYKETVSFVNGYPAYVSSSTSKAVWYQEGAWVIGSGTDYSVYAKLETSNECPNMVDPNDVRRSANDPKWFVYNSVSQDWQPGNNLSFLQVA